MIWFVFIVGIDLLSFYFFCKISFKFRNFALACFLLGWFLLADVNRLNLIFFSVYINIIVISYGAVKYHRLLRCLPKFQNLNQFDPLLTKNLLKNIVDGIYSSSYYFVALITCVIYTNLPI